MSVGDEKYRKMKPAQMVNALQEVQAAAENNYALVRPWAKMLVVLLALAGTLLAGYLTYHHYVLSSQPLICFVGGTDCEDVQSSDFGSWFGVPVAVFGLIGYVAITLAALVALRTHGRLLLGLTNAQLGLATFGFAASIYFTSIEAFVLHKWCAWCVGSAILMTLVFLFSMADRLMLRKVAYEYPEE